MSKTGSIEEEQLNPFKVTKDQTKVLSQCFARMGWKLKHTADEAKKFAKGGVRPGKIETVNDTMEAQEKLFSDATGLLKKWGEGRRDHNLRKFHQGQPEQIWIQGLILCESSGLGGLSEFRALGV